MFHTLRNVQNGDAVTLQRYIDNRAVCCCAPSPRASADGLLVGLRSITYTVGWYNVEGGESFSWRSEGGPITTLNIPAGLWSFSLLQDKLITAGTGLKVNKATGLITLTIAVGFAVQLTDGLLALLGLIDGLGGHWLDEGVYEGDRPVDFAVTKTLHLHLDQVNTTYNAVDGAPSTMLAVIGLGSHFFGDINTVRVEHHEFKRMQHGTIGELKVTIKDEKGSKLDNHDLPISIVLEIA